MPSNYHPHTLSSVTSTTLSCRLEDMSQMELEAEKTDLMEELDDVVEELGGLSRKEDRQEMAGLYQRLRNLKRITRKPSFSR